MNESDDMDLTDPTTRDKISDEIELVSNELPTKRAKCPYQRLGTLSRKRVKHLDQWEKNHRKSKVNYGLQHTSKRGKIIAEKKVQTGCDKCKYKCSDNLSEAARKDLNKKFWTIGDRNLQRSYVRESIIFKNKDLVDEPSTRNRRKYSFIVNGQKVFVCKTTFMATLDISDRWFRTIIHKLKRKSYISPDGRGKSMEHRKTIPAETTQSVKDHILSMPRVEGHYVRSNSSREYLEESLSIAELHRLYLKWKEENHPHLQAATYRQYLDVFNTFNIGFHKPKKDQCDACVGYKNGSKNSSLSAEEKKVLEKNHKTHMENKRKGRDRKTADKIYGLKKENIDRVVVSCFDYQKVLSVPKAETSVLFRMVR